MRHPFPFPQTQQQGPLGWSPVPSPLYTRRVPSKKQSPCCHRYGDSMERVEPSFLVRTWGSRECGTDWGEEGAGERILQICVWSPWLTPKLPMCETTCIQPSTGLGPELQGWELLLPPSLQTDPQLVHSRVGGGTRGHKKWARMCGLNPTGLTGCLNNSINISRVS